MFLEQGDDDRNVDFAQMVGLVDLLRARGVYYELTVIPDDVHESLIHSRWIDIFSRSSDFLHRFVWDKQAPPAMTTNGTSDRRPPARPARGFLPFIVLAIDTLVLALQKTKHHALLPATQTKMLWLAEGATIACALILRSGWGRDSRWRDAQERLGTLANNFYEPRRAALIHGWAIGTAVFLALWWGTATWSVVLFGMRRGVMTNGLLDFEVATSVGALTGGIIGAVIGLASDIAGRRATVGTPGPIGCPLNA